MFCICPRQVVERYVWPCHTVVRNYHTTGEKPALFHAAVLGVIMYFEEAGAINRLALFIVDSRKVNRAHMFKIVGGIAISIQAQRGDLFGVEKESTDVHTYEFGGLDSAGSLVGGR